MSDKELSRKEAAEKIISAPQKYKVCESCGSIVVKKADVCPNCNAYRFDISAESVTAQAKLLAARNPLSIEKNDYI
ncbi:MAG: hypothetical protein PHD76_12000 [Methylacidiphilales bacterium]|nr:hypothetical protein [Candidatus Methylacidiphilales bacterium]